MTESTAREFKIEVNAITFRWSETNQAWELTSSTADRESCYVIAFFRLESGGYHMETVGDRYFTNDDQLSVNLVAKHALQYLNLIFVIEQAIEESK